MRTTWTIGKTLNLAFLAVAAIVLFLGVTGFYGILSLSETTHELGTDTVGSLKSLLTVGMVQNAIDSGENGLLNPSLAAEERADTYVRFDEFKSQVDGAISEFKSLHEGGESAAEIAAFEKAWVAWWGAHETFVGLSHELEKTDIFNPASLKADLQKFRADHLTLIRSVEHSIDENTELKVTDDPTACDFGKWLATYETSNNAISSALAEIKPLHDQVHMCVRQIREQVTKGDKVAAQLLVQNDQEPALNKVVGQFDVALAEASNAQSIYDKMASQMEINDRLVGELVTTRDKLLALNQEEAADTVRQAGVQSVRLETLSATAMIGGVAFSLLLGIVISRRTNNALRKIASDLATGSQQTTSAAGQVSQSSQAMAAGASEQASSIEETSASLEEITSMTRQNADNAMQAKKLAEVANASAEKGAESMDRMGTAIIDIKKSSDETAKIIKSIDEIAFQTNLLALNAAVEAARAGDAGKGFAVVAEEVRNLAQRSAEAAKNTASMIETSVNNADRGVKISTEVGGSLKEISESVHKVNNLVGEIASASNEQARGIEQIGTAMNQLNQVTQTNAATSEQAAAAAEELGAQAEEMNRMVDQLRAMVGGANGNGAGHMHERRALAGPARKALPPAARNRSVKVAKPESVIPLDDDDMKDF